MSPARCALLAVAVVCSVAVVAQAQSLSGANVRVTTHDLIVTDPFVAPSGVPDVLQQNEPSIALHPAFPGLVAVGMNDVRSLGVSGDAWQGLAVSTTGGASFGFEALVPGFPGDTSAAGLASPILGNHAASDPWLSFDKHDHLFFAFIAFQRTPPGQPDFSPRERNAIAVAKYDVTTSGGAPTGVAYDKTVVVELGTVGLGRQEDKEALAVDNTGSPFDGNVYVCWARFTGSTSHLKVARSTDHGESFTIADIFADQNMQGCNLTVAPNGDVYVSWRTFDRNSRNTNPQDSAVFVARSTNGGADFGSPVRVATFVDYRQNATRTPPVFRVSSDTALAADGDGVYLGWTQKNPETGADVMISRSTDGGLTWESPVTPHSLLSGHQIMPSLAAGAGKLSVVWFDSRSEPAFTPAGPVSGQCPPGATDGTGCSGMAVFYSQADTAAPGALSFGPELSVTSHPFNPNLYGSIRAITPFIGDYVQVAVSGPDAFVVWADNRDINPTANASEDADATTDPPALINARSRDSNIYFQKVLK